MEVSRRKLLHHGLELFSLPYFLQDEVITAPLPTDAVADDDVIPVQESGTQFGGEVVWVSLPLYFVLYWHFEITMACISFTFC